MNVLFVHNNFPAQFRHVVRALVDGGKARVAAICASTAVVPTHVLAETYDTPAGTMAHAFARRFDHECQRAEAVLYAALRLKGGGFQPDVIVAHSGWGETLPLREVFPRAKIIVYCEFYYRSYGLDVGFDPEFSSFGVDGRVGINIRNAAQLLALADADIGISPTQWQRSTYPMELQSKIHVIHEGVDTSRIVPNPTAVFGGPSGHVFKAGDEVVTFVSRNLEPLRGIHVFLRSLPRLLSRRVNAHVVIVGGNGVSYGAAPPAPFRSWKDMYWQEIAPHIDQRRVHFTGRLSYAAYIALLQISAAHAYLTYPFVLSWSLLEAMSAGCAVMGSDTAPVTEVLSRDTGHVVPFFDIDEQADRLEYLLRYRGNARELGIKARNRIVENYDMATICRPALLRLIGSV